MADDKGQDTIDRDEMEEMLSIGEASDYIGVSVDTLRRWSKKERVTTYRSPGGHRYYKKKDLKDLFDAKYTRDEPTERSSQEKTQESAQKDPQQQPTQEPATGDSDPDEISIPKMQPVKVISDVENPSNYPIPDLMTPPPPMPTIPQTQTFHNMNKSSFSAMQDQHTTQSPQQQTQQQYYRKPASPITSPHENGQKPTDISDTIISDHTQTGLRQPAQPTAQEPVEQPEPTQTDMSQDIGSGEETGDFAAKSTKNIDDIKLKMPEEPVKHTTPPWRRDPVDTEEKSKVNTESSSEEESIEKEPETKKTAQQTKKEVQEVKKTETIQKNISIDPDEEEIEQDQKQPAREDQNKSESKPEVKTAIEEPPQKKKTIEESVQEAQQPKESPKKAQEDKQKRSILEPDEGIDASKLNRIEKLEDEGWFSKNKSNIMIGFTVFLLIDIILFVIWLTTSRLLSPLP